jgi:hypothetical protein
MTNIEPILFEIVATMRASDLIKEFEKAQTIGGITFFFGVDMTTLGPCLTINHRRQGIYLHSEVPQFESIYKDSNYVASKDWVGVIAPDEEQKGNVVGKAYDGLVAIYVAPDEYRQFLAEAKHVADLYCRNNIVFREIPDVWFSEMRLIQFIKNKLKPHPLLEAWFIRSNEVSGTPTRLGKKRE